MYENKAISSSSVFGFSGGFSAGFSCPNAAVAARQIAAATVSRLPTRVMAVSPCSLECALAVLARPYPLRIVERGHEDLAVADGSGLGSGGDQGDNLVGPGVRHDHLDLHLGEKVYRILPAPAPLGRALLAPEPA